MAGSGRPGSLVTHVFALLAAVSCLAAFAQIEGRVYLRRGDNRVPLAGAFVGVRSSERGPFLATVRTDSEGRYRIVGLPPQRIVVSASRPGYYTELAGGRKGSEVPLDCSGGCNAAGVHFELVPGAVVSGFVLDGRGDPLERVSVSVISVDGTARGREGRERVDTDDRGSFRVAGLRPGAYLVRARLTRQGSAFEADPLRVELSAGEEHSGIQLTLRSPGSGSPTAETASSGGDSLRPTAAVRGTVKVSAGSPPPQFRLSISSNSGLGRHRIRVRAPRYSFNLSDLVPGSYRIRSNSRDVYVKGILQGNEVVSPDGVTILSGANQLQIIAAADHGWVYGTIREPGTGWPLPWARVALDGAEGIRPVQADQHGRFSFDRVVPGEYRICAWTDISPSVIADERSWEAAGCMDKIIPVEPDSEVEVDLTAAP